MKATTTAGSRHGANGTLFAMCLALVLVVASVSALNLALPELAVSLGASTHELTWIADAYTVALAALVLPLGALGDRLGRRNVLVAGAAVFAVSSALAALCTTSSQLIACRVGMGVGAAMIMPGTLSTITSSFPRERRASGVAIWSGFAAAGAILGLLAAGILLEQWGWESIFVASAITAVVAGGAAIALAPNTHEDDHSTIDALGAAFLVLAIGSLVYGIIQGSEGSYGDVPVVVAFVATIVGVTGYVASSLRNPAPLLDPRLFRAPMLQAGALVVVAQFLALFGFFFVGLQYLQLVLEFGPLMAAVALVPVGLVVLPTSRATPWLAERVGPRVVMVIGLLLIAVGLFVISTLDADAEYPSFLAGILVAGLGIGLTGATGTTAITGSLGPEKQGVASAINDATREIGAALGIAIMGSAYSTAYLDGLPSLDRLPETAADATRESAAAGLDVAARIGTEGEALAVSVRDAFIDGLAVSLQVAVVILVLAAVAVAASGVVERRRGSRKASPAMR